MGLLDNWGYPEAPTQKMSLLDQFIDAFPDNRARRLQEEEMRRRQAMQDEELAYTRKQRGLLDQQQAAQQAAQQRRMSYLDSVSPSSGPAMPVDPAAALMAGITPQEMALLDPKQKTETPFAKINPADYTPESVQQFLSTGNYGALKPRDKDDINSMIVRDPVTGQPKLNQLYIEGKKATRPSPVQVNVGTGQKDANWGTPPKDYVWARDSAGNVMTERDPASGAFRPIATPIGGSKDERTVKMETQQAADKASRTYQTIDQMLRHPGLDTAIGMSGQIDPRNYMWGTQAQGARALIEQAQGQAFLQAFESLKGGGAITQVEGEKATAAIARLQRAQSDADFRAAAEELKQIAATAYQRATGRRINEGPTIRPMGDASLDDLLKKYGN